jgi:hypothetical protein
VGRDYFPKAFMAAARRPVRQASEQNFTESQSFAHLRRQVNGRPQAGQIFAGRAAFFTFAPAKPS